MRKEMVLAILRDLKRFYDMYSIPAAQTAAVVLVLMLAAGCVYAHWHGGIAARRRMIVQKAVLAALLADYAYIVIGITMLSRRESYSDIVNLKLFSTFQNTFTGMKIVYENFILLIPWAILLYAFSAVFRNVFTAFLTGFLSSLAIETAQMCTHLGRFELDDIMTNTIGFLAGFLFCVVMCKMCSAVRNLVSYRGKQ